VTPNTFSVGDFPEKFRANCPSDGSERRFARRIFEIFRNESGSAFRISRATYCGVGVCMKGMGSSCPVPYSPMSAFGTKRTSQSLVRMSAFGGNADMGGAGDISLMTHIRHDGR
jgi:hypothetical protein